MEVHHGALDRRPATCFVCSTKYGTCRWRCVEAGYSQDEISQARRAARAAGLTESTGFGMDRLTEAGRARGRELVERFVR